MLVSAAFVDLNRHSRALAGMATVTEHTKLNPGQFGNITRSARNEQGVLQRTIEAAEAHPEAFTGAVDVAGGIGKLRAAADTLAAVRELVSPEGGAAVRSKSFSPLPPTFKKATWDASAATPLLRAAARDVEEGHALLGGTRAMPAFEAAEDGVLLPTPSIAPADHPAVVGEGHQAFQRKVHKVFDSGLAAALGIRAHSAENVPMEGAGILALNHGSMTDTIFQAHPLDRPLRAIANAKLWDGPIGPRIEKLGAFPVTQGDAAEALAVERGILANGGMPFHYDDGMIHHGDYDGSPANGPAQLALEMDVPVIPGGTYGNKPRVFRGEGFGRPLVDTVYGKPISFGGAAPTVENVGIARETIKREQSSLRLQAREHYLEHRAESKARAPIYAGGALATAGGVAAAYAQRDE